MEIVIDFDGTLALGNNKSIEDLIPNYRLISLINKMYEDGNIIKIATARGSKSCKTLEEKQNKYQKLIAVWLKKHNVHYNVLSFNKDYGDVYIDDRAYNANETFVYEKLDSPFTDNKVRRFNKSVIKRCNSSKDETRWYEHAKKINLKNVINILHCDEDTLTTEYITNNGFCKNTQKIVDILNVFKHTETITLARRKSYDDRIYSYLQNNNLFNIHPKKSLTFFEALKATDIPSSFNHGDFSVDNILEDDKNIFLIDPILNDNLYQSYYIDIAKHLFTVLFYKYDVVYFNELKNIYAKHFNLSETTIQVLMLSEGLRVCNRKKNLLDIVNNLIDEF